VVVVVLLLLLLLLHDSCHRLTARFSQHHKPKLRLAWMQNVVKSPPQQVC
jgi:hypothetical protein